MSITGSWLRVTIIGGRVDLMKDALKGGSGIYWRIRGDEEWSGLGGVDVRHPKIIYYIYMVTIYGFSHANIGKKKRRKIV